MPSEEIAYHFRDAVPMDDVEDSLRLAEIAVRGLHGDSRARLEVHHLVDCETRTCRIEAISQVGRDLATIFTAFVTAQFGAREFTILRRSVR
jgi:hypothetical protein